MSKKVRLAEELAQAQIGREETEDRSSVLEDLEKRKVQRSNLAKELEQHQSCDPQRLQELRMFAFLKIFLLFWSCFRGGN